MVTSNKQPDKKVVKMGDHNNSAVVPQRTLIGEVNEHITCPLCRGYYIDATTIVECLHSFCRSCIIKHLKAKSYCPVCEMMINSAKPNIKLDKALQDIVYKLVPGLFQKEMERRQQFYASRPGPAASATPEQRGEDTERIIFSPEDVISFSLEYSDVTDTDSISSKSSDSNELPSNPATTRRYLQCPAVVNISHLKKFLSMKFDIDSTQFAIDILYKRVPLPDYYTLMDIAYIYNWKRNEPMRFFYQIIDYVAIRNRIFDINRKSSLQENKASPALMEDTNASSPTPHSNDQVSEASSGTDSPMPDENNIKKVNDIKKEKVESKGVKETTDKLNTDKNSSSEKKNDEDVEKSQFLNSFELTAKSNCLPKTSPGKSNNESSSSDSPPKSQLPESLKRKYTTTTNTPELKKFKIELEKAKIPNIINNTANISHSSGVSPMASQNKISDSAMRSRDDTPSKSNQNNQPNSSASTVTPTSPLINRDVKPPQGPISQQHTSEISGVKRPVVPLQNLATPKRKPPNEIHSVQQSSSVQKTVSPLKIQVPKLETQLSVPKTTDVQKTSTKKMPDLKPSAPTSQTLQNKGPPMNKVRMDLLANNSDPTMDRSKILSQVKTSLGSQNITTPSGDPLKSLFDSCKINIPSSLSITLTDQKLDPRNPGEQVTSDTKKSVVNKNLVSASNSLAHKVPSPPVHNYIEILKLPDSDPKKSNKNEPSVEGKNIQNKSDGNSGVPPKLSNKSSETSAKGPIPNLKPISDTKLGKQSANYSNAGPITFQQTFEQQIQTLQGDKKSKLPKNKAQVPKLVPATPKSLSAANKPNALINKPITTENKSSTALDLSSPHNVQLQSGVHPTFDKAFETMQSIANLAKKQNLTKGMPSSLSQNASFSNRNLNSGMTSLRIPSTNNMNQIKIDKALPGGSSSNNSRQELLNANNPPKSSNGSSPTTPNSGFQMSPHTSMSSAQPSPRQIRSPSSSPKLVIAEEKQSSTLLEQNINQSNQVTSTQLSNANTSKNDSSPAVAGPSKIGLKPLKSITPSGKITGRQPITPNLKNATDYPQFIATHASLMRHQMEMSAWFKATQRQYDFDIYKMTHQNQSDFNNKDKQ